MDQERISEPSGARLYLGPLAARLWLIVLIVMLGTGGALVYSLSRPNEYTAATKLFVQSSELDQALSEISPTPSSDRTTENQATLIKSRTVAQEAARRIGFDGPPERLLDSVDVTPAVGSDFVTIKATRRDPGDAARVANAFADAFIAVRTRALRERVTAAIQGAQRELSRLTGAEARRPLQSRIRRLQALEAVPAASPEQVDRAQPPNGRSAPRPMRNALFAFAISLLVGIAAAYALERFDRRIRRVGDLESSFRLPLLASVPHIRNSMPAANGRVVSPDALKESFRTLRVNLRMAAVDSPLRTILVTSAIPDEGKSTVVRNLALAHRDAGGRVAVLECDLRRPSLSQLFDVDAQPGLTDVLTDATGLADTLQTVEARTHGVGSGDQTDQPSDVSTDPVTHGEAALGHLSVLTSGTKPPNPPAMLATQRVRSVIDDVAGAYDLVLIDSAPLLTVSDAIPLMSEVDGVLIVTRLGLTTRDAARRVVELLDRVPGARVVGIVANDLRRGIGGPDYAYYGYHERA